MWLFLLGVNVGVALLLVVLSLPMARGAVGPNRWYGLRCRETLEDEEIWYAVNTYFGRRMVAIGLQVAVAAVVLYFVPGMNMVLYSLLLPGMLSAGVILVALQALRMAKRMDREKHARHQPAPEQE